VIVRIIAVDLAYPEAHLERRVDEGGGFIYPSIEERRRAVTKES
jgi:hypothetical protein